MKRFILILMTLFLLTGCGSGAPSTTTTAAEAQVETTEADNPYTVYEYNGFVLAYPKEWRVEEGSDCLDFYPGEEKYPIVELFLSDTDMEADGAHDFFVDYAVSEGQDYDDLEYEFEAGKERILYKASYTDRNLYVYECTTVYSKHIFMALCINKEEIPDEIKRQINIILGHVTAK